MATRSRDCVEPGSEGRGEPACVSASGLQCDLAGVRASQEVREAPLCSIVPGPRVDPNRLGPNAPRLDPVPGGFELSDTIQDCPVQRGQVLGKIRLHPREDGGEPGSRYGPPVPGRTSPIGVTPQLPASVAAMTPASNAEWSECAGPRHPGDAHAVDDGRRRSLVQPLLEVDQALARALRDAPDRPIGLVGDPAAQIEVPRRRAARSTESRRPGRAHEPLRRDAGSPRRRASAGSGGCAGSARPGKDDRIEDEFGRDVRREKLGGPRSAIEERLGTAWRDGCGHGGKLLEQDGVPDRSGTIAADEHDVAGHVEPQSEQAFDRTTALRGGHRAWAELIVDGALSPRRLRRPRAYAPASGSSWPACEGEAVTAARLPAAPRLRGPRVGAVASAAGSSAAASAIARGTAARAAASRADGRASVKSSRSRASSARIRTASGARAYARARPGRPPASLPSRDAVGGSATAWSARIASMSRGPTSPRRTRAQRDRTVGSSRASPSAQSTMVTPDGGSSSVLRSADCASSFIRSAPSMIATRGPPSTGMRASSEMRSRTPRQREPGPPITTWRPGPTGSRRWRSGWVRWSTSRQARHARHGRVDTSAVHMRPAARSSASVVLPTPSGPTMSTACGTGPRIIAATAAVAAG